MERNYYLFVTIATRVVMVLDSKDYFELVFSWFTHFVNSLNLNLFMLVIINTKKFTGSSLHIDFLTLKLTGLEDEGNWNWLEYLSFLEGYLVRNDCLLS